MSEEIGERVDFNDLRVIYGEEFSNDDVPDFEFSVDDLNGDGDLFVRDSFPGGFVVIDGDGNTVMPGQREHVENGNVTGTDVELGGFDVIGRWKIRYNRGKRGIQGKDCEIGTVSSDELMMYALIFS